MGEEESIAERWARQARDLVGVAGAKTEQYARVGRLQLDLLAIRREMQQEYRKLGERTRQLIGEDRIAGIAEDAVAAAILKRLDQLEADRTRREADIERARAESGKEERS